MVALPPVPTEAAQEQLRPRVVRYVLPFVELGEAAGADVDRLLTAVGLSRAALRNPKTRRPYYQLHWLVEQLILESGDPEIGLRAAERESFASAELLGSMIRHFTRLSPDVLSVLRLLASFGTHVCRTLRADLDVKDDLVTITIVPIIAPPPELYDCSAGACCALIEALGGASARPLEVRLPRACPTRPERYEKFFGSKVVFDAPELTLVYAHAALTVPADESAAPDAPSTALTARAGSALVMQIRTHVLAGLADGVPLFASVARKVGLSVRTLRRRLTEVHSSYAELVDEARRERALSLARRPELDVSRLAELTGFADASAFARAFRRWTGERPHAYLRRARRR